MPVATHVLNHAADRPRHLAVRGPGGALTYGELAGRIKGTRVPQVGVLLVSAADPVEVLVMALAADLAGVTPLVCDPAQHARLTSRPFSRETPLDACGTSRSASGDTPRDAWSDTSRGAWSDTSRGLWSDTSRGASGGTPLDVLGGTALDVFGSTPLRTSPGTPLGTETSPGTPLGTDTPPRSARSETSPGTPPRSSQPETTGGVTGLEPLGVRPGGGWACFTSGSSGRPRAVVRSRESWTGSFTHLNALTGIGPDDTVLVPGPLNSSLYGFAAVHALGTGATAILPGRWSLADIDDATVVHTVPHLLPQVLPSNVRTVIVGGAALDPTMRDSRVISYYGATELSFVAIDVDGRGLRPFPEVEIEVRADEVWVRSPWVADGYLINPDNPPHRNADNPPHRHADGLLHRGASGPPSQDADAPPHSAADGPLHCDTGSPPRQDADGSPRRNADSPPHRDADRPLRREAEAAPRRAADGPLHCDTGGPPLRDPDGLLHRDANDPPLRDPDGLVHCDADDPPLRDPGDPLRRAADGPLHRDADGPLRRDAHGWLTVGDLGAYEPGGVLRLRGRGAGAIQTGGATVVAEDVEAVLRRVPGVVDVVVVGSPHPHLGAVVTAIVEGTAPRAALEEAARAGLDPAQRPRRWHTAERLPRTPTGKPARNLTADAFERLR